MITKEQIDRLRNDEGGFSEPDVRTIEKITGKKFQDVVAEAESEPEILINGKPVTHKEQVKHPNDRAKYFNALREQGKRPKQEYDKLQ